MLCEPLEAAPSLNMGLPIGCWVMDCGGMNELAMGGWLMDGGGGASGGWVVDQERGIIGPG